MTGTVLRVSGSTRAVREFLDSTHWKPCATYFRGQLVRPTSTRISQVSGFNLIVSRASRLSLAAQTRAAQKFITNEAQELRRLRKFALRGVMDFGVASRPEAAASFYRFPTSLLALLASTALDLEVSYYGVEER